MITYKYNNGRREIAFPNLLNAHFKNIQSAGAAAAPTPSPKTHSMREAAALLGVHTATLYRWDGKHPAPIRRAARDGRRRFTGEDIEIIRAWMGKIETVPPAPRAGAE